MDSLSFCPFYDGPSPLWSLRVSFLQISAGLLRDREHGWVHRHDRGACACGSSPLVQTASSTRQNAKVMLELLLPPPTLSSRPSLICGGYGCMRTTRGNDLIGCDWAPTCALRPEQPKQTSRPSLTPVLKPKSAQSWHVRQCLSASDAVWRAITGRWRWCGGFMGIKTLVRILPQCCRSCEKTNSEPRERSVKPRVLQAKIPKGWCCVWNTSLSFPAVFSPLIFYFFMLSLLFLIFF